MPRETCSTTFASGACSRRWAPLEEGQASSTDPVQSFQGPYVQLTSEARPTRDQLPIRCVSRKRTRTSNRPSSKVRAQEVDRSNDPKQSFPRYFHAMEPGGIEPPTSCLQIRP